MEKIIENVEEIWLDANPIIRYEVAISFDTPTIVELHKDYEKDFYVEALSWRRYRDSQINYPSRFSITDEEVNRIKEIIFKTNISPYAHGLCSGFDGTSYKVQFGGRYGSTFTWWSGCPDEWKILIDLGNILFNRCRFENLIWQAEKVEKKPLLTDFGD